MQGRKNRMGSDTCLDRALTPTSSASNILLSMDTDGTPQDAVDCWRSSRRSFASSVLPSRKSDAHTSTEACRRW